MIDHIRFFWHLLFRRRELNPKFPWYVQHRDNVLFLAGKRVPNAKVEKLLGDGANGLVFQIFNEELQRHEALKLWLRLRQGDQRNKAIQAIEEARKQALAAGSDVVQIHTVVQIRGVVLARMEFISGMNLKTHLQTHPETRLEMLVRYVELMQRTTQPGIYHGDPHDGNILVHRLQNDKYNQHWALKLCDFGTSHFEDAPLAGKTRHWLKMRETTEKLAKKLPAAKTHWKTFERNDANVIEWLTAPAPAHLPKHEQEEIEIKLRFGPYRDLINDITETAMWKSL